MQKGLEMSGKYELFRLGIGREGNVSTWGRIRTFIRMILKFC